MTNRYFASSLIMTLMALCLPLTSLLAQGQPAQYENQVIEKIEIIINGPAGSNFNADAARARIKTKEGDLFSQQEFDADLKTLANDFDRVVPTLESVGGKLQITLKIWPKPTIRTITWEGNDKIKTKRLHKELGIPTCSIFDRLTFNKAFHKLKAYYVKKGFFEAQLEYNVTLDPITNEVDIIIDICEGRAGRIKNIILRNFTECEEEEIYDMLLTKEYCFYMSWLTNEGTYNEEMIQQDQFVVLNYLQNKGYADARVDIEVREAKECNRINIVITATKGEKYHVGKMTIKGNTMFCDDEIWAQFNFCEGSIYSPELIRETIKHITDLYGRFGYIDAVVNYEPRLECDTLTYNIDFTIEEGAQFRIGMIKVFGNCSTQTNVILHECLLIPGSIFNIVRMQKTEEKLRNIGYFKAVNVYAVKSEGLCGLGDNFRDVHIEVEETNTGNFGAFFGFSTIESVFGGFNVTEKNFNYQGLPRFWNEGYRALRGGGEYAHFTATIGAQSRSYVLSWTKPFYKDTPWTVGFDLESASTRYISKNYDIETVGLTIRGMKSLHQFLRLGVHYRIVNSDVHVSHNIEEDEQNPNFDEHKQAGYRREEKEAHNAGLVSAAGISLVYDSTDHPQNPRKGFKSRLENELAGLGGRFKFASFAYLNTYYIPTGKKGVLKLRGDMRFIVPMFNQKADRIPLDERLFLGGDNTVRGYRSYKLGPEFTHNGDPRGGVSMQLLSIEYMRPLYKRFDAFIYVDAGHLSLQNWNFGRLYVAPGFGCRFSVFESGPPLTVGMGFPVNPKTRGQVKKFFLMVGGRF